MENKYIALLFDGRLECLVHRTQHSTADHALKFREGAFPWISIISYIVNDDHRTTQRDQLVGQRP